MDLEQLNAELIKAQSEVANIKEDIKDSTTYVEQLNTEKAELTTEIAVLTEAIAGGNAEKSDLQSAIASAEQAVKQADDLIKDQYASNNIDFNLSLAEINAEEHFGGDEAAYMVFSNITGLNGEIIEKSKDDIKKYKTNVKVLDDQLMTWETQKEASTNVLTQKEADLADSESHLAKLRTDLEKAEEEVKTLITQIEAATDGGFTKIVRHIKEAVENVEDERNERVISADLEAAGREFEDSQTAITSINDYVTANNTSYADNTAKINADAAEQLGDAMANAIFANIPETIMGDWMPTDAEFNNLKDANASRLARVNSLMELMKEEFTKEAKAKSDLQEQKGFDSEGMSDSFAKMVEEYEEACESLDKFEDGSFGHLANFAEEIGNSVIKPIQKVTDTRAVENKTGFEIERAIEKIEEAHKADEISAAEANLEIASIRQDEAGFVYNDILRRVGILGSMGESVSDLNKSYDTFGRGGDSFKKEWGAQLDKITVLFDEISSTKAKEENHKADLVKANDEFKKEWADRLAVLTAEVEATLKSKLESQAIKDEKIKKASEAESDNSPEAPALIIEAQDAMNDYVRACNDHESAEYNKLVEKHTANYKLAYYAGSIKAVEDAIDTLYCEPYTPNTRTSGDGAVTGTAPIVMGYEWTGEAEDVEEDRPMVKYLTDELKNQYLPMIGSDFKVEVEDGEEVVEVPATYHVGVHLGYYPITSAWGSFFNSQEVSPFGGVA